MNWEQIEGKWEQFKGGAQKRWGKLTNDDLDVIDGNRKQLVGKIQDQYGKTEEAAEKEVADWLAKH
ncbi:MAG: CsbD family protein [Pseudomonadota bacterium]